KRERLLANTSKDYRRSDWLNRLAHVWSEWRAGGDGSNEGSSRNCLLRQDCLHIGPRQFSHRYSFRLTGHFRPRRLEDVDHLLDGRDAADWFFRKRKAVSDRSHQSSVDQHRRARHACKDARAIDVLAAELRDDRRLARTGEAG